MRAHGLPTYPHWSRPTNYGSVAKFRWPREDGLNTSGAGMSEFKRRHFEGEIILWVVRWYCRYGISYRDLEQIMGERGVPVDHSTIYRWVNGSRRRSKSGCAGSGAARNRRAGGHRVSVLSWPGVQVRDPG